MSTVEAIVAELQQRAQTGEPFDLFISDALTYAGQPAPSAVVMAIVGDHALAHGYITAGSDTRDGGRSYRFEPWSDGP